jgi:hypothetical protein
MKLVIHTPYLGNGESLHAWQPEDEEAFAEFISLGIGTKGKKGSDDFFIMIATPRGLQQLISSGTKTFIGRPLLVMERYNFKEIWKWLEQTILSCEGETWLECVERLRYYFDWEFDGYKV